VIVNTLADGAARAAGAVAGVRCAQGMEIAASGWVAPVIAHITSGFHTPDRPGHSGVDLGAARGTTVRAAASGIVIAVACSARRKSGGWYGCDRDGSLQVTGCGWWAEIQHAGNIITRYCHMGKRPDVVVGQQVAAGQAIGVVGATGNVTGPHLHFEVHINGDRSSAGAINPVPFMRKQGAPVGVVS
jgi:murein DD-endopeptidase MepM/ murein hydrolase activator NlpD